VVRAAKNSEERRFMKNSQFSGINRTRLCANVDKLQCGIGERSTSAQWQEALRLGAVMGLTALVPVAHQAGELENAQVLSVRRHAAFVT
jgi:hypothetical protein